MIKRILAGAIACLLLFPVVSFAVSDDSNITTKKRSFDNKQYKEIIWFSAYNVGDDAGTTYKYNEIEGTSDSSGIVDAVRYTISKTIQIDVIALVSASIDVRVEGRAGSSAEWGEIVTVNFAAVTGANNSHIINVTEYVEEIRVGVKANTPGTDSVTITGLLLGDDA